MKIKLIALFTFTLALLPQYAFANTKVVLETTSGDIELELYDKKAPKTVENFKKYVTDKHYDNTIFHRVIKDFMIQGGGYTPQLSKKETRKPIKNEASNGLSNDKGTIAMARTGEPHSATAQFFINVEDNSNLNYTAPTARGYGYTVFGRVTKGMTVVNKIRMVSTKSNGPFGNLPVENVIIKKARLKK